MSKARLSLLSKIDLKQKRIIICITICFIFFSSLVYSLFLTKQTFNHLLNRDFINANQKAQQAIFLPRILSKVTLGKSSTIESWKTGLELVPLLINLESNATKLSQSLLNPEPTQINLITFGDDLAIINDKTVQLQNNLHSSLIFRNLSLTKKVDQVLTFSKQIQTALETINKEDHTFLVLLQNTEELRASGGFMGSYARVDLKEGKVSNINIQDIYEPDGQFTGFVEAPPGAKEYLSGGEGLRLPDANWHPDFPTSAKVISSYFAFGDEKKIDSIVTLNVDLIEKIIRVVGEVYLPDYGLTVTADNLTALARADRNSFFAGSKQKTNFLASLFDHLKIRLTKLDPKQQEQIAQIVLTGLGHKDIQLFSWHSELQEIFNKNNIAGEIEYREQSDFYLYLPETNVGINKANKKITRDVKINLGQNRTEITVNFINNNSQSSLDYINYQRIILDPMVTVKEIKYDGQTIHFYEDLISNSNGNTFKQVGFLIPLESGLSKTLSITLTHSDICLENTCKLQIQKQSGLPPTPYQIKYRDEIRNIVLEKDEVIEF